MGYLRSWEEVVVVKKQVLPSGGSKARGEKVFLRLDTEVKNYIELAAKCTYRSAASYMTWSSIFVASQILKIPLPKGLEHLDYSKGLAILPRGEDPHL
jgi:uncharacterized protein (DUF1778 family)